VRCNGCIPNVAWAVKRRRDDISDGRNIDLIDVNTVLNITASQGAKAVDPTTISMPASLRTHPICGAAMVKQMARQGASKGQIVYGCSTYPRWRGTRPVG